VAEGRQRKVEFCAQNISENLIMLMEIQPSKQIKNWKFKIHAFMRL
jgi:hypothetical protein